MRKRRPMRGCGINLKHGYCISENPLKRSMYRIWGGMIQRCYNPRNVAFKHYGGRGIKVCKLWVDNFINFARSLGDRPGWEYSLGRIDNDGDYSPKNCQWETSKQQANNKERKRKRKKLPYKFYIDDGTRGHMDRQWRSKHLIVIKRKGNKV